ncbi:hypothetical protein Hanom_Chr12g01088171 [Helianthus anomalus]
MMMCDQPCRATSPPLLQTLSVLPEEIKRISGPALGVGGEDHRPGPGISEGTLFLEKKTRYVYVKISFLIGYTYTNTNICPLTKLFLYFRLVITQWTLGLDLY